MLAIRIACRFSALHPIRALPRYLTRNASPDEQVDKQTESRMAFGFHPNTETILAPDQSLILTRTLHFNQLPPCVSGGSYELTCSLEPEFREAIVQAVGKDKRVLTRKYKEKQERELNTSDYYFTLIMNLLRLGLLPLGPDQPVLTYKPYITFEWQAFDTFSHSQEWMRVRGRPFGWLVSSSKERAPPLFAPDVSMVQELSNNSLPDIHPVSPFIGMDQHKQRPSIYAGTHPDQEKFRVPHTLVYLDNPDLSHKANFQSAVFHLFSLISSYATLHCGAAADSDLAVPLSGQAIQTSGRGYTFLYYQLNTLHLSEHGPGLKNLLYTSDQKMPLYTFDLELEEVQNLNMECLRLFVHTLNNTVASNSL